MTESSTLCATACRVCGWIKQLTGLRLKVEDGRARVCGGSEGLISAEVINYERVSFSKTELETSSASAPVSYQESLDGR